MSLEWSNIKSNTVADLKYACSKYGLKINKGMKKEQLVELLENYKTQHKNVVKRSENDFSNSNQSSDKLQEMLMRVQPKLPSITPQRSRKSMWLHTPSQIFAEKDAEIPIADTPAFRSKVQEMTKVYEDKKKNNFSEKEVIPKENKVEEPLVFIPKPVKQEVYMTPDVGRKVVTPIIKAVRSPVITHTSAKTTSTSQSPRFSERIEYVQISSHQRRRKPKALVFVVFAVFISIIALLLFNSQM